MGVRPARRLTDIQSAYLEAFEMSLYARDPERGQEELRYLFCEMLDDADPTLHARIEHRQLAERAHDKRRWSRLPRAEASWGA